MTFQWLLTGAALVFAFATWARARRLGKRLDRLTESYWELRYEHGQLRARVNRLDPDPTATSPDDQTRAVPPGVNAFVPLSSLKR